MIYPAYPCLFEKTFTGKNQKKKKITNTSNETIKIKRNFGASYKVPVDLLSVKVESFSDIS